MFRLIRYPLITKKISSAGTFIAYAMERSLTSNTIDLTPFPELYTEENITVHKIFKKYGFDLRIAGGAVRDILLGVSPHDIDFATDATPSQMCEMFSKEGIRMLNRNGESHGTVTARINDKENFEVTTLRIDVVTDGRHSEVIFTNDWKLDAERRDLTVNSMFLSVDMHELFDDVNGKTIENSSNNRRKVKGYLWDYFNGRDDLNNHRIRFVGDADTRIKEDYLRILRYFRFHGRLAIEATYDEHDENVLKTIASNANGLSKISGERCWSELKKILLCPSTPFLLRRMANAGLFVHLGLPENPNFDELDKIWRRDIISISPDPITCLAAIMTSPDEVKKLNERLHLSNLEIAILLYILKKRDYCSGLSNKEGCDGFRFYEKEFLLSSEPSKIKPAITEMLKYLGNDKLLVDKWLLWQPPKCPVNGTMLIDQWGIRDKLIRPVMTKIRQQWCESDYKLTADELLNESNKQLILDHLNDYSVMEPEKLVIKSKKSRR
ncbi:CCA tRNA nucleotidyltransferase 1 isoform 1 [Schistosoma japonicum]|nr:CCA tRNA nucleotidyltransferase 1 isoform 1 [Schistosoma japonicum]